MNHAASFRDPSGFLFTRDGVLYRQVNRSYAEDYRLLMDSGLYAALVKAGLLVRHEEVSQPPAEPELAACVLQPERLLFISYPYEWCFGELKDAALATLTIQKKALEKGMSLKDASAYNIQFRNARPLLIDTLSFERYVEGQPWTAYRQFCQHFLAPLALMAYTDVRLGQLLRLYMDGVPLDLASRLLPGRTRLNFGLLTHIHLHANAQRRYADQQVQRQAVAQRVSKMGLIGLVESLENTVRQLEWKAGGTEWGDYYDATNYTATAFEDKRRILAEWIETIAPQTCWDLGGNTGVFSRLASERKSFTVSFDIDPTAVEQNYRRCRKEKTERLLPLLMDLTNPSPAQGWDHTERESLAGRGPADLVMALALVHHLAIANNVPLSRLAQSFARLGKTLIVEFVPKSDSQVQRLLASRLDIFPDYTPEGFEAAFASFFELRQRHPVQDSQRLLYWFERRT
jgi:ribosomal protein L11 methylase PrmA